MDLDIDLKKHFSDEEERTAFSRALDLARKTLKYCEAEFTDFLDMEKITAFMEKLSRLDVKIDSFGGVNDCERRIIGFFPDFMECRKEMFPIKPVIIKHSPKFGKKLGHRDYLGSILGLGIDRRKIGDIFVLEECALAFVHLDIIGYIAANLEYVGRTKVSCEIYEGSLDIIPEKKIIERFITAASLRLDAVMAAAFNISRSKALSYINAEVVRVNWKTVSNVSFGIKENDLISVKGLGRVRISEIKGATKKNRIGIIIGIDA